MKEDSKSLAQAGMLTEIKDVVNLKVLIEEVRLDQDIKAQVCVHVILCELEYRMSYYQGGCIICGFDITKSAHSYPM